MAKKKDIYQIEVVGVSESDLRAATPNDIKPLIDSGTSKPTALMKFEITKTQVELLLQKGDTLKATQALQHYIDSEDDGYQCALNVFQRDMQNGRHPYIGASSFFGAFRDATEIMFPKSFYQKRGDKAPSKTHLRKVVHVKPYHVFLYRNGTDKIETPDDTEGQQPVGRVKGFARYEVIRHPFEFKFRLQINPTTKLFSEVLSDSDAVIKIVEQSAWHGIGGCRGAGYGMWKAQSAEIVA